MNQPSPNYLFEASQKPSLDLIDVPLIEATTKSVKGYGYLVDDPDSCEIEIVTWPAQGWRPIDQETGNQGGTVEGIFLAYIAADTSMDPALPVEKTLLVLDRKDALVPDSRMNIKPLATIAPKGNCPVGR